MSANDTGSVPDATARRFFFALWPDEALQQRLYRLGAELLGNSSGRRLPPENLHLTLAFLGAVVDEDLSCLEREAAAIHSPAFSLTLDQAGIWRQRGILWVGGAPPQELGVLVQAINGGLGACGRSVDARPFRVHVTLARNVRARDLSDPRPVPGMTWAVRRFALVGSRTLPQGARYEVLRTWRLEV